MIIILFILLFGRLFYMFVYNWHIIQKEILHSYDNPVMLIFKV